VICLLGPTAAGKSALALDLAPQINAEIISADSMQVYRGMDIGTAKLSPAERRGIPHHLIDVRDPDQEWTVSDFVAEVEKLTKDISARGKAPLLVGGTGLYLWSLLEGFSFPIAPADKDLRSRMEKEPLSELYKRLESVDPASAKKIHPNDRKRMIRALEVYELTGKAISELGRTRNTEHGTQNTVLIGLTLPREELYRRINERVDQMIEKGLIEEVEGLIAKGYARDLPSFQALGYKEVVRYLDGGWEKEEMITELKKRTRHFARRQMTWFRRFRNVHWIEAGLPTEAILAKVGDLVSALQQRPLV
jgi:tRNA dimethylallyltransferase